MMEWFGWGITRYVMVAIVSSLNTVRYVVGNGMTPWNARRYKLEAKETVLDTIRIYNITGVDVVNVGQWKRIRPICEAQAEISFKAGYKQAREEMNLQTMSLAELLLTQRQEGRKEVVEWIENNAEQEIGLQGQGNYYVISDGKLQAHCGASGRNKCL